MGEIMEENYDAAWIATIATSRGARKAKEELQPQINALAAEIASLRRANVIEDIVTGILGLLAGAAIALVVTIALHDAIERALR